MTWFIVTHISVRKNLPSFYQYKNQKTSHILHTGRLKFCMCLKEMRSRCFRQTICPSVLPSVLPFVLKKPADIYSADNLLLITFNRQRPAISAQSATREPLVHTCAHLARRPALPRLLQIIRHHTCRTRSSTIGSRAIGIKKKSFEPNRGLRSGLKKEALS